MTAPLGPVPDPDSAPYWEGLARGELLVQGCSACGALQFPFRPACVRCLAPAPEPRRVSGRGHVLSWVVTHRAFHPALAERVPYTTVLVRLDEGDDLLMYGAWPASAPPPTDGLPVIARFAASLLEWSATNLQSK